MRLVQYKGHWTPLGSEKAWERYARRANDMLQAVGLCRQLRTVIQAGGNIGAWPVWLAANFVDVMTFEPEKTNYQCLVRNTEAHHNITPYHPTTLPSPTLSAQSISKSVRVSAATI